MKTQPIGGAALWFESGYELHSITLSRRNWQKVKSGENLKIRGKGFHSDGEFFWDYWRFERGFEGELFVSFGSDEGELFRGSLSDVNIELHE